jgi:hypothetical protein
MLNKVEKNMFMAPTDIHEIVKYIELLKKTNSSGYDNITSSFLQDIKHEIAKPLKILFNKSIESGTVPDLLKLTKVIPIYKSKDKTLLTYFVITVCSQNTRKKLFIRDYIIFYFNMQCFIPANMALDLATQPRKP